MKTDDGQGAALRPHLAQHLEAGQDRLQRAEVVLVDEGVLGQRQHDRSAMATITQIQLRGLAATGRASVAARLLAQPGPTLAPAAPQWP